MTSNSDGLSPSLRPQLGVGWNRALPAPFGFDNGIRGDGVNDFLVSRNVNIPVTRPMTIEFWINFTSVSGAQDILQFLTLNNSYKLGRTNGNLRINKASLTSDSDGSANRICNIVGVLNQRSHIVINVLANNLLQTSINGQAFADSTNQLSGTFIENNESIKTVFLFKSEDYGFCSTPIDELRVYRKNLTIEQIRTHYNNGVGENPSETENLICWYKFQEFENLDFSVLQNNSDIRLGIKDLTVNAIHLQPINMDTNPTSATYSLKPF